MKRLPPEKTPSQAYCQLWRIVDGAVRDALEQHPDYIREGASKRAVRNSINKRVTGAVLGYATEVAKGRSGASPAAESEAPWLSGRFWRRFLRSLRSTAGLCTRFRQRAGVQYPARPLGPRYG